ncbi:MAG: TasA family protein, partial [Marmoricola sp.]
MAVGSGATFTSTSGNTISAVTAGTLTQSNSKADQAIFNLSNMKPGDTVTGTLTLTNTGSLAAAFSLVEVSS